MDEPRHITGALPEHAQRQFHWVTWSALTLLKTVAEALQDTELVLAIDCWIFLKHERYGRELSMQEHKRCIAVGERRVT